MKLLAPVVLSICGVFMLVAGCDSNEPGDSPSGGGGEGGETTNTSSQTTDDTDETICADLDEDSCEATEACYPELGYGPYLPGHVAGERTRESKTYLGCRYLGVGGDRWLCGTAITCGYEPNAGSSCWQFRDNCLPDGWEYTQCSTECPIEGAGGAGGGSN